MSSKLQQRLAELEAAETLADLSYLPPMRCHLLTEGREQGLFTVDLKHPYRLVFKPDHDPVPRKSDGSFDLRRITAIEVISIVDTHKRG